MSRRKTQEEFIEELYQKNNHDINVIGEYKTNKHKVEVLFENCGHVRHMIPSKLLAGQGCGHPECKAKSIASARLGERIHTAKHEFDKLGYRLLSEFKGVKKNVKVKRRKCGHTYEANAGNILRGSGCPTCYGLKTPEIFEEEIRKRYGDEYTIIGAYETGLTKIDVRHNGCGLIWSTLPKDLLRDKRCPNCYTSKGEAYIRDFLISKGVEYEMEYKINECRHKRPLPFDFAIKINGELRLIEFDGSQHFGNSNYWGDDNQYDNIRRNDNIKNDYCRENNIPLLRIPYWWLRNDKIDEALNGFIT